MVANLEPHVLNLLAKFASWRSQLRDHRLLHRHIRIKFTSWVPYAESLPQVWEKDHNENMAASAFVEEMPVVGWCMVSCLVPFLPSSSCRVSLASNSCCEKAENIALGIS